MTFKTLHIEGQECVLITKDVLMELIQGKAAEMRESKRKGVCSLDEALKILGCSKKTFRNLIKETGCLIKKSSVHGKYITESIHKESMRERPRRKG